MEVDDGPPPFCGIPEDLEDHSMTFDKSDSLPEEDDANIINNTQDLPNISSEADISTAHSFSRLSIGENETTASTANDGLNEDWGKFESTSDSKDNNLEDNSEDDEWGDFGEAPKSIMHSNEEEDDDDWGDFDQARPSEIKRDSTNESPALSQQQSIEEWGNFENSEVSTKNDEDNWQAEFCSSSSAKIISENSNFKSLNEILDDEEFWEDGFDSSESVGNDLDFVDNLTMCDIPSLFDDDRLSFEYINENEDQRKYALLWLSLRVVEEALSLKFEWKSSNIQHNHYLALKIDPNYKPAASKPNFDVNSILLPTPLQTSENSTDNSQSVSNSNKEAISNGGISKTPSSESPSIPVVDFDWDTSGLTNPLKGASQSSAIIDVDFLSTNGMASSYTNPLQKDLAEFGLNTTSKVVNGQSPNLLESLMSKGASTDGRKSPYVNSQVLSLDAKNLLEQLPDLQYLQANMLCFPMGSRATMNSQFPN